jgi:trehalose 6-phosphate synthase
MVAYDLIGFQTARWRDNFAACVRGTLGRPVLPRIGVFPVGIEPEVFANEAAGEDCEEIARLRASLRGRALVLGVDRLDYSKGIPERLDAFARMLELEPRWRGQVSFIQISVPSRADVPEYAELRDRVENLVGHINGLYGEADWVPVQYLYRSYERRVLAQLYRLADVCMVTPLRDGLNLVAKEFVASQDDSDPGVLLLSRFAGASEELDAAVVTNPYHRDGMASDLARSLDLASDERRDRQRLMRAAVERSTAAGWAQQFLATLGGAAIATPRRPGRKAG